MRWVISTLSIFATAYLLPGAEVSQFTTAIAMALVLGVLNATVKPLLIIFTLPLTFVTFGLFLFVINALMILLLDYFFDGFAVKGFGWALIFSLVLTVINTVMLRLGGKGEEEN